jgi:hypothetical protein
VQLGAEAASPLLSDELEGAEDLQPTVSINSVTVNSKMKHLMISFDMPHFFGFSDFSMNSLRLFAQASAVFWSWLLVPALLVE